MHWGIKYLRRDIQELRQELRQEIRDLRQELRASLSRVRKGPGPGTGSAGVQEEIERRQELHRSIAGLREEIQVFRLELLRTIDSRFYWTLGVIVTLFWVQSGLMVALIKL